MQYSKWIFLGFGTLCLLAVGTVMPAERLYGMAAILITLPIVSYLLGYFALPGLHFKRKFPPAIYEGEEITIFYEVANNSSYPRFFISAHDIFPDWIVPYSPEFPLVNVAGSEKVQIPVRVSCRHRGVFAPEEFVATALDPLGVFTLSRKIEGGDEMVVYPAPLVFRSGAEGVDGRFGMEERISVMLRGGGVTPEGVRPYVPGDPLRRIHWRQTARTGTLSVVEYEDPQWVRLLIAINPGPHSPKGENSSLENAIRLAAWIAGTGVRQGVNVRLCAPADKEYAFVDTGDGRGEAHLNTIMDALARYEPENVCSVANTLFNLGVKTGNSGLFVVSTGADEELGEYLKAWLNLGGKAAVAVMVEEGNREAALAEKVNYVQRLEEVGVDAVLLKTDLIGRAAVNYKDDSSKKEQK